MVCFISVVVDNGVYVFISVAVDNGVCVLFYKCSC